MTRLTRCTGGCGELVSTSSGKCYDCRRSWQRAYDEGRPEHHSVYRSSAWKKLSAEVRAAETRCRWCLRPLPIRDRVADHIVPLAYAPHLAYDRDNLAVACRGCNRRRGHWARVIDPGAVPSTVGIEPVRRGAQRPAPSVSEEMAAIFGGDG